MQFNIVKDIIDCQKKFLVKQEQLLAGLATISDRKTSEWKIILDNYEDYKQFNIASQNDNIKMRASYPIDILCKEYYEVQKELEDFYKKDICGDTHDSIVIINPDYDDKVNCYIKTRKETETLKDILYKYRIVYKTLYSKGDNE